MAWNYRVFRHENPDGSGFYMIHETFYGDGGKVDRWTEDGARVGADTSTDILSVLAMMADALGHPILDAGTGKQIEPARELTDDLRRVIALGKTDLFELDLDREGNFVTGRSAPPRSPSEASAGKLEGEETRDEPPLYISREEGNSSSRRSTDLLRGSSREGSASDE